MKKSRRRKNNRAGEKREVADINKNQVTRMKVKEKASMAESMRTACLFPF